MVSPVKTQEWPLQGKFGRKDPNEKIGLRGEDINGHLHMELLLYLGQLWIAIDPGPASALDSFQVSKESVLRGTGFLERIKKAHLSFSLLPVVI